MTKAEALAWKNETAASIHEWRADPVHTGPGRVLAYKGGAEAGFYFEIRPAGAAGVTLTVGRYTGAIPHIGDALFKQEGVKAFESAAAAEAFMAMRGGVGPAFFLELARQRAYT